MPIYMPVMLARANLDMLNKTYCVFSDKVHIASMHAGIQEELLLRLAEDVYQCFYMLSISLYTSKLCILLYSS